jgi:hypothetical protein
MVRRHLVPGAVTIQESGSAIKSVSHSPRPPCRQRRQAMSARTFLPWSLAPMPLEVYWRPFPYPRPPTRRMLHRNRTRMYRLFPEIWGTPARRLQPRVQNRLQRFPIGRPRCNRPRLPIWMRPRFRCFRICCLNRRPGKLTAYRLLSKFRRSWAISDRSASRCRACKLAILQLEPNLVLKRRKFRVCLTTRPRLHQPGGDAGGLPGQLQRPNL